MIPRHVAQNVTKMTVFFEKIGGYLNTDPKFLLTVPGGNNDR